MSTRSPREHLNYILSLCTHGTSPFETSGVAYRTFGLGLEDAISFIGENSLHFESAIGDFMSSIPGLKDSLSRKRLEDFLIPEVRRKKIDASIFDDSETDSLVAAFLNLPLQKFRVLRRIFGIEMPTNTTSLRIGDFSIHKAQSILNNIKNKQLLTSSLENTRASDAFIECEVQARDDDKALELADSLFSRFELIFRVLIGRRTRRLEVGVLNYVGPQMRHRIIVREDGRPWSHGSSWQGALQLIPLGDPFFAQLSAPLGRLIKLLSRNNNKLETHILHSAEWIGQAIGEPNPASAFVKAAIALEVLFSINEKGAITPSIMAQIAEGCAFILGKSPADALEIERQVKGFYRTRSAIVHSGKESVSEVELDAFIAICRSTVIVLLDNEEFAKMHSIEDLVQCLRKRKYASLAGNASRDMPR